MLNRQDMEKLEHEMLAPYAAFSDKSQGRKYSNTLCPMRPEFQRDRDRVIHCAAFRKLEYKTQVYVIHEGDYYRTRLTHTMEVAQIANSLARVLRLNQDLTEAVALAHDLGHTPFGHTGEFALNRLMRDHGGFEHNRQGVRIVELLEERFADHPGLNLTWEVRESIAKHSTSYDSPRNVGFDQHLAPALEAQLVDLADEIAFNDHDLDDALKMGIITPRDLKRIPWVAELYSEINPNDAQSTGKMETIPRCRLIGKMIDLLVRDALKQTEKNIEERGIKTLDDIRQCNKRLASFSPEILERNTLLRSFLMERVYRHPNVVRMSSKAERFIERLFNLYLTTPGQLPWRFQERIESEGPEPVIADYISGMTDRYCIEEYKRAFLP